MPCRAAARQQADALALSRQVPCCCCWAGQSQSCWLAHINMAGRSLQQVLSRAAIGCTHRCCRRGFGSQPAVFLRGALDMALGDHPIPELPTTADVAAGRAEPSVLVDVEVVGICGSDMHYYKDGGIGSASVGPGNAFVPGHEFAGRVVADDSGRFQPGELVAVDPAKPCGQCEWCHRAHHNLCPHVEFTGAPPFDGALTPQILAAQRQLYRLPAGMSAVEAMMLEPLGVAIHGIDLAKPQVRCSPRVRPAAHMQRLTAHTRATDVRERGCGRLWPNRPQADPTVQAGRCSRNLGCRAPEVQKGGGRCCWG